MLRISVSNLQKDRVEGSKLQDENMKLKCKTHKLGVFLVTIIQLSTLFNLLCAAARIKKIFIF